MKAIKLVAVAGVIIVVSFATSHVLHDNISSINSIAPVTYADNRDGISARLAVKDQGIVLRYGQAPGGSDGNGARDVFVYKSGSTYYMTYDGEGSSNWSVNEATSINLTDWTELGQVLTNGPEGSMDSGSADYGTLYKDGDVWHMFYLGTQNQSGAPENVPSPAYATLEATSNSPTGPWQKNATIPFKPTGGTYYTTTTSPGPIIRSGKQYLMFVSVGNDASRSIAIARTDNLDGTWKLDPQPVVPETEQLENASMYYQASTKTWFMFADHVGLDKNGTEYTDAIWAYWSQDLNHWNTADKAIAVDGSTSNWSHQIIGLPSVVQVGKKLAIFYDGKPTGLDYTQPLEDHVKRDIGLAWVQLPIVVKSNQ